MIKILFSQKVDNLYKQIEEKDAKIELYTSKIRELENQVDCLLGIDKNICNNGIYCKFCKNSYPIGSSMTPMDFIEYGCKLKIPCRNFVRDEQHEN